jgi:hypothetical protein
MEENDTKKWIRMKVLNKNEKGQKYYKMQWKNIV